MDNHIPTLHFVHCRGMWLYKVRLHFVHCRGVWLYKVRLHVVHCRNAWLYKVRLHLHCVCDSTCAIAVETVSGREKIGRICCFKMMEGRVALAPPCWFRRMALLSKLRKAGGLVA